MDTDRMHRLIYSELLQLCWQWRPAMLCVIDHDYQCLRCIIGDKWSWGLLKEKWLKCQGRSRMIATWCTAKMQFFFVSLSDVGRHSKRGHESRSQLLRFSCWFGHSKQKKRIYVRRRRNNMIIPDPICSDSNLSLCICIL